MKATGPASQTTNPGSLAVLLPLGLQGSYDYLPGVFGTIPPGSFVRVPLRRSHQVGVVWDGAPKASLELNVALKAVEEVLPFSPLPDSLRRFVDWVADYYMVPQGAVLRMVMSERSLFSAPRQVKEWRAAEGSVHGNEKQHRVLALAAERSWPSLSALARAAGVSAAVARGLADRGALIEAWRAESPNLPGRPPDLTLRGSVPLNAEQQTAVRQLTAQLDKGQGGVTLLEGVTGSGKTEVYFEAIASAIGSGQQALVLLPEIALSAQWLARFQRRFGAAPVVWHSECSQKQRQAAWRQVLAGGPLVVVGARSALFLPFPKLGLIIVDEEHESAYKQEDGVPYHARDMAVLRGHLAHIPVVLVSATPSLETLRNVETGRYSVAYLRQRHGLAGMPALNAIDLRQDRPPRQSWLAPSLRLRLAETVAAGEQALLFLNRRGYAPLTLCRNCGHRMGCPDCSAWLVDHRSHHYLQCHHCGFQLPKPGKCPACEAQDSLAACGPGVERVAEEVNQLFPAARIMVVTSDTITGPRAAEAFVERMQKREIDILIGTQIVAKGHHFPHLTLVGVVDSDIGLRGGDLRAAERTWQMLHQVAGRAGRADRPGQVLMQTYDPAHPVIAALLSGDQARFLAVEMAERQAMAMPPFGRLAALILSSPDLESLDEMADGLARRAAELEGVRILGPAPAPLAYLRGRHRKRFLIQARRGQALQPVMTAWLESVPLHPQVRWKIDIDPYSFL